MFYSELSSKTDTAGKTKLYFRVGQAFLIFLIFTLPIIPFHCSLNFCISIIFNLSWYNNNTQEKLEPRKSPFLLIFVVFDRFILKVLLLCHLIFIWQTNAIVVCENRWELLKIILLRENYCIFGIFLICRTSLQPHVNSQNVQMCSVTV